MKLKWIGGAIVLIGWLIGWLMGWRTGRNSVERVERTPVSGVVSVEDVEKNMTEIKPDTVYVPYFAGKSADTSELKKVPVESLEPGPERDTAMYAALLDWNTKRSYSGTFFDDPAKGTFSYSFDVQFNRTGPIKYNFEPPPVPVPKQRIKLRPVIGGEYYTNGWYSFGGGIQYGAIGLNVRMLSTRGKGLAFGAGVQIIF